MKAGNHRNFPAEKWGQPALERRLPASSKRGMRFECLSRAYHDRPSGVNIYPNQEVFVCQNLLLSIQTPKSA